MPFLTPNEKIIIRYVKKFENDERYSLADKIIKKLIGRFSSNKKLDDILVKVSVINNLYSTNVFATFRLAKHIQSSNLDSLIKKGNPLAVQKIANGHKINSTKNKKEIYFYSFATKYCNWHNQDSYPIYDKYVEKILIAYRKQDNFSKFRKYDLKTYDEFKRVMLDFKKFYSLQKHNLKEIDKFLWIYGKEKFNNK